MDNKCVVFIFTELPPDYIILVLVCPSMHIGCKKGLLSVRIDEPAKRRMTAHQVNGILHTKIHKGFGKVVHRFVRFADGDEDLTGTAAEGLTHGLVLEVIFHEDAIVYQGELAKEISLLLSGFLKKR